MKAFFISKFLPKFVAFYPLTLETPIEYVKGIGPERAKLIKNVLAISTVEDLLHFYPIRYIDRNKVYKVGNLQESNLEIQLKGKITNIQEIHNGKVKRLTAKFNDDTGSMDLVWFQYSKWLKEQLPVNREVLFSERSMLLIISFRCHIRKLS